MTSNQIRQPSGDTVEDCLLQSSSPGVRAVLSPTIEFELRQMGRETQDETGNMQALMAYYVQTLFLPVD